MSESVSIKEHFEALRTADLRAIDLLAQDLRAWKREHNNLQQAMLERDARFITKVEHENVIKQIGVLERLVYIGIGISVALQFVARWLKP